SVVPENKVLSQTLERFSGVWQAGFRGSPVFILRLKRSGNRLEGSLSVPKSLSMGDKGELTEVKWEPHGDAPVVASRVEGQVLAFQVRDSDGDIDAFELRLIGPNLAEFTMVLPPEANGQVALPLKMIRQQAKPK